MYKQNPVVKEAHIRGDYAYFSFQLRYGKNPNKWKRRDIKKAVPIIDRLAVEDADRH